MELDKKHFSEPLATAYSKMSEIVCLTASTLKIDNLIKPPLIVVTVKPFEYFLLKKMFCSYLVYIIIIP